MAEIRITLSFLVTVLQFESLLSINSDILNILQPLQILTQETNDSCSEIELEIVVGVDRAVPEFHLRSSVSFVGNIHQVLNMDFNYEHKKNIAVLMPTNESSFFNTLQQISSAIQYEFHSWRPYWFLCYPNEINSQVLETVKKAVLESQSDSSENKGVPLDSDFYLVFHLSDGIETNLTIWELYNVKSHSILSEINYENLSDIGFIVNISRKTTRRNNFELVNITGTAGYDVDYPFETAFSNSSNTTFTTGLSVSLFRDLKDTLNFSELAVAGTWMVKKESDGIDWLVINGFADIAISQTTLTLDTTPETNESLTFIQPTSSARLYAILVQPPASTIRNIFVTPFSNSLWTVLAISLLFIVFTTLGIAGIKRRAGHWDPGAETISHQATIWILGTVCQQATEGYWNQAPVSASMKIVFMTAATAGMVCYIGYSAAIVSVLTNKVIPIRNVLDLRSSKLPIYGDENNALAEYVFEGLVNKTNEKSLLSPADGLSVISKMSSAFLGFTDAFVGAARRLNFTEKCLCDKFSYLPFSRVEYKSSMFIKKGSPFREFFNHKVIVLKEKGLNDKYLSNYYRMANLRCAEEKATEKRSLGLNDVFTSFAMLLTAYFLCIAILVFEKIGSVSAPSFGSFSFDNRVLSLENIVSSGKTEVSVFTIRSEVSSNRERSASRRSSL